MPTEKPRFTIVADDELFKKVEDFRFENRYQSRSAAALELMRLGLEAFEKQNKNKKK